MCIAYRSAVSNPGRNARVAPSSDDRPDEDHGSRRRLHRGQQVDGHLVQSLEPRAGAQWAVESMRDGCAEEQDESIILGNIWATIRPMLVASMWLPVLR